MAMCASSKLRFLLYSGPVATFWMQVRSEIGMSASLICVTLCCESKKAVALANFVERV